MAVAAEGFSIREYAWKMRSVDVGKCWPLDPTYEDEMKSMLPPITVEKFTWWFDKLQLECSDNGNSKKKLTRDGGTSQNDRNDIAESDNSVDRIRRVAKKGKAPKKRSIVELFAVAPQVEIVANADDYYEDDEMVTDSDNDRTYVYPNSEFSGAKSVNLDKKGKKKEKKLVKTNLKKQKKVTKKDNKKKEKTRELGFLDFKIAKKERSYKIRVNSHVNFAAYLNGSLHKKKFSKENSDAISTLRKKPQLKQSTTEKKRNDTGITKSLSKFQEPEVGIRGILKSQKEVIPIQSSTSCIMGDASKENGGGTCEAHKHVTFTVDNNIFGSMSARSDDVAFVKGSSQEIRETSNFVNENGDYITSNSTGNDGHEPSSDQVNLFDRCLTTNLNPLLGKHLYLLDESFGVASRDPVYACNLGYGKSPEGYGTHQVLQVIGNSSSASSIPAESRDLSGNHGPRLAEVCYKDFMKTNPQPSSSYLSKSNVNAMQGPLFPSKMTRRNYGDLQHYPFRHFSPKELMRTICSVPNWKQENVIVGDISMDENFVGLPLNSQGELIKLNSSGQRWFDQLTRPSTAAGPSTNLAAPTNISLCQSNYSDFSSWDGRTPPDEHFQFFPSKDTVNQTPYLAMPQGFGGAYYHSTRQTNFGSVDMNEYSHSIHQVESNLDRMILPQHHRPDHVSVPGTQPTMRLMGKEFTVGTSNLQPFEVGNVWTDKQIIAEHLSGNDALATSSRINVNEDLESFSPMEIPNSRRSFVDQDVFGLISESPHVVHSLSNYDLVFQEPVKLGYKVSNVSSQARLCACDDSSKGVSSSYNNLPHATNSCFSFPFLHSLSEDHSLSSWWPNTSRSIVPSTSNATRNGTFMGSFPSFPDLGNSPPNVPRSEAFPSYNSFLPYSAVQNRAGLNVSSHRPPVPLIPRSTLNLSLQSRYDDSFRFNDQINLPCKRTNKRAASSSQNFMKPSKIPNLTFQENYSCTGKGALKDHAIHEGDVRCMVNTNQSDQFEVVQNRFNVLSGVDYSELNTFTRDGPIKLTAGAKHILKPCQKASPNNSRSTQSNIHFIETTTGDKDLQSQKSAKIYKF